MGRIHATFEDQNHNIYDGFVQPEALRAGNRVSISGGPHEAAIQSVLWTSNMDSYQGIDAWVKVTT